MENPGMATAVTNFRLSCGSSGCEEADDVEADSAKQLEYELVAEQISHLLKRIPALQNWIHQQQD